jgi:hypothetical protein
VIEYEYRAAEYEYRAAEYEYRAAEYEYSPSYSYSYSFSSSYSLSYSYSMKPRRNEPSFDHQKRHLYRIVIELPRGDRVRVPRCGVRGGVRTHPKPNKRLQ